MTTILRRAIVTGLAAALWCAMAPKDARAQETALVDAKRFYESADYEEALKVLDSAPGVRRDPEAAAYRVFCLIALGRASEAKAGVEAIVKADPLFRVSDAQVSPRLRSFFDEIRKPLLPDLARQTYATAKAAFDRKEWTAAVAEFDRAIALLGELGAAAPGAEDLKFLAANFRDLAKASIEPPKPPPPPPPAEKVETKAPEKPVEPEIYGVQHTTVKRPVSLSKPVPDWRPVGVEERMVFEGVLEVIVNERGKVDSARMLRPAHPRYDTELLKMALNWSFKPATKDGVAVKYRYAMAISLAR
jgi:TonB family protein